jgi:hypothetical protein
MTRTLSHFRQADFVRAVRACKAAGVKVERIDIAVDGKISVFVKRNGNTENINTWDEVLGDHDRDQT